MPGIVPGGAGDPPATQTNTVTGATGSNVISDNTIAAATPAARSRTSIPANSSSGRSPTPGRVPDHEHRCGHYRDVHGGNGSPVDPTGPVSSITLSAEGDPSDWPPARPPTRCSTPTRDGRRRHWKRPDKPVIKPVMSTDTYYNHYSWLRTMEDIFSAGAGHAARCRPEQCPAASTARGTSATRPSPACGRSARRNPRGYGEGTGWMPSSSQTALARVRPGHGPRSPSGHRLALIVGGGSAWYLRRRRGGQSRCALSGRS